jgi:hypothetical protein
MKNYGYLVGVGCITLILLYLMAYAKKAIVYLVGVLCCNLSAVELSLVPCIMLCEN